MGSVLNLPIKRSVSIDTMLNFDCDGHEHGDGYGTRKQTLTPLRIFSRVINYPDKMNFPLLLPNFFHAQFFVKMYLFRELKMLL